MHGNVWEYVADCFHENYKGAPDDGSEWLAKECKSRVIRGGSWHDFTEAMRLANRSRITPNDKINPIYGFRLIQVF